MCLHPLTPDVSHAPADGAAAAERSLPHRLADELDRRHPTYAGAWAQLLAAPGRVESGSGALADASDSRATGGRSRTRGPVAPRADADPRRGPAVAAAGLGLAGGAGGRGAGGLLLALALALAFLATPGRTGAQAPTADEAAAVALVQRVEAAYAAGDLAAFAALLADECVVDKVESGGPFVARGRAAVLDLLRAQTGAGFRYTTHGHAMAGDGDAAAVVFQYTKTDAAARQLGAPPTTGTGEARVREGRLAAWVLREDAESYRQQQVALRAAQTRAIATRQAGAAPAAAVATQAARGQGAWRERVGDAGRGPLAAGGLALAAAVLLALAAALTRPRAAA